MCKFSQKYHQTLEEISVLFCFFSFLAKLRGVTTPTWTTGVIISIKNFVNTVFAVVGPSAKNANFAPCENVSHRVRMFRTV